MARKEKHRAINRYRNGERLTLKDGRTAVCVVDMAREQQVLALFPDGTRTSLPYAMVEWAPPKSHYSFEQWQQMWDKR